MMTDCWKLDTADRPSFSAIVDRVGNLQKEYKVRTLRRRLTVCYDTLYSGRRLVTLQENVLCLEAIPVGGLLSTSVRGYAFGK